MKQKVKEKLLKINYDVFGYTLYVCLTSDIAESRLNQSDLFGKPEDKLHPSVDGLHIHNDDKGVSAIFITPSSSIGVIAHEISHALWRLFEYIGADLENETYAYHLSFTLDKVLPFFEKNKKYVNGK